MPGLSRGCTAEAGAICSVAGRPILLCLACARYRVDRDLWTSIHAGEGEWFWIAGLEQFAARQTRAVVREVVQEELARTATGWLRMIVIALGGYVLGKALF